MLFPFGMIISTTSSPSIKDVMTSEAFVPWKHYTMSGVTVTPIGTDGALISYRVKAIRPDANGSDSTFRSLVSSAWRRTSEHGRWLMCFHQQSPYDQPIEDLV